MGRVVQASGCEGKGRGSLSHSRHFLGLASLGLALGTGQDKVAWGLPWRDPNHRNWAINRPHPCPR